MVELMIFSASRRGAEIAEGDIIQRRHRTRVD